MPEKALASIRADVDEGVARARGVLPEYLDCFREAEQVVILQAGGKVMGLRVHELLGSEDLVIKSLSQNFVHIRGLSGASILGDGSVCLTLDVATLMTLAIEAARGERPA